MNSPTIDNSQNIEVTVKKFTEKIISTVKITIETTSNCSKPRVPLWNDEIKEAIKIKN